MPFIAFVLECIQNNCQVYTYYSDTKTCTFALNDATPVAKPGAYSAGSYCYPIKPWRHPQAFIDHLPKQSEIPLCKNDYNFGCVHISLVASSFENIELYQLQNGEIWNWNIIYCFPYFSFEFMSTYIQPKLKWSFSE